MAAISNGLCYRYSALCGDVVIFSDYARPALRLAALVDLPAVYVFTHDALGGGEDGPTHQPIEHLAS
jgi:transketolase